MSSRQQIDRALRKAQTRDQKRRTKMRVSGSSVKTLHRLLGGRAK